MRISLGKRTRTGHAFVLASIIFGGSVGQAQTAGSLDPAFDTIVSGGNNFVSGMTVQPDRRILLVGSFTEVDGQTCNGIGRLNADGGIESAAAFNVGTGADNNPVNTAPYGIAVQCGAVQTDGKILLGGYFPSVNGQPRRRIARLNADGTVESTASFNVGSGVNGPSSWGGTVYSIAVQSDGKIILVGDFSSVDGQERHGIARLNADGSVESAATFKIGTGASIANSTAYSVRCVAVQTDGKILIGGGFGYVNAQPRNGIARLNSDGTVEDTSTFDVGTGANSNVWNITVQPNGKILIGGDFTLVNGQPRRRIARLNSDGSLESTATFNIGTGTNDPVSSLALQADGKILIGGIFTSVNGQPRRRIARLNADGTVESTTTFNIGTGADNAVYHNINGVTIQADGKILLCGEFTTFNGEPRSKIARLLNDAAPQILSASSSARLVWMRAGAAPEVSQVMFEKSIDGGSSWSLLGIGRRIEGGWELTGMALTGYEKIRARGRTTGGFANGSSGLVETVASLTPAPDISVEYPVDSEILSGATTLDFGPVGLGSSSTRTVTIRSTGTADLINLAVTKTADGTPGDFTIGALGTTTLPRDASTTFDVSFSPSAAGVRSATIEIASSDPDESPFVIHLIGTLATPLEAWRKQHFGFPGNTGIAADLSDPDKDGIVNLIEFGTGSDPNAPTLRPGELVKNGNTLEFTYTRRKAALSELSFVREFSDSLTGTWSTTGSTSLQTILTDDGTFQRVKVTVPGGTAGKRFVRLRVSRL